MKIIRHPKTMQTFRQGLKRTQTVGFVPTMGALHEGHVSLVKRARRETDMVVVSIFVNPLQFGPREDFGRYPRPFERDVALLKKERVDILFAPSNELMTPPEALTRVSVGGLTEHLCGDARFRGAPHFDGVATIVAKLFNVVAPDKAYFGLKDFQQVRVIEQMVHDLNMRIQIIRCPTRREADGLALSSRNAYLSPTERALASRLPRALQQGGKLLTSHKIKDGQALCKLVRKEINKIPNVRIDYVELVDAKTLRPAPGAAGLLVLAAAIHIGKTRLIDNIIINLHEKKLPR